MDGWILSLFYAFIALSMLLFYCCRKTLGFLSAAYFLSLMFFSSHYFFFSFPALSFFVQAGDSQQSPGASEPQAEPESSETDSPQVGS